MSEIEVVELLKVPFTAREQAALRRVADYFNLSPEDTLKRLLFREDNFGQASRRRIAAGAPPIY